MPLPLARCAFPRSSAGTSTVILRTVSMTPQYTIPDTSIDYVLGGHSQQQPFVRRRSVYNGRKPTLSVHSSAHGLGDAATAGSLCLPEKLRRHLDGDLAHCLHDASVYDTRHQHRLWRHG